MSARRGAVSSFPGPMAVQRFRSDLGLYVHLHCLVTDGAYEEIPWVMVARYG